MLRAKEGIHHNYGQMRKLRRLGSAVIRFRGAGFSGIVSSRQNEFAQLQNHTHATSRTNTERMRNEMRSTCVLQFSLGESMIL